MGLMQRMKGKKFEREIAAALRVHWPAAIIRRASQAERADNPDVFIEGQPLLARLWLELQDAAAPTPLKKLEQAERDIRSWRERRGGATDETHRMPVVVWHKLRAQETHATMPLWVLDDLRGHVAWSKGVVVTMTLDEFVRVLAEAVLRVNAPTLQQRSEPHTAAGA